MRVGIVTDAQPFPEARRPALKLTIDFGPELGTKRRARRSPHTIARLTSSGAA